MFRKSSLVFNWEINLVTNSAFFSRKPVFNEIVCLSRENYLSENYSRLNAENFIFS